jgi:hypothetical protein
MTNPNEAKTIVQYPYRAVICGEEHIVKDCRAGNLLTDKDEFVFSQLHGGYPIQSARLLEVAFLKLDGNGEWLLNGCNLKSLQSLMPTGSRLYGITSGEVLRVHKGEVHAVAWVQANSAGDITELLDIRHFTHNTFGGGFCGGIIGEGLHPAFTCRRVGEPIISEFPARCVNFRLAVAVTYGDGKSHATVGSSGISLCKLCANYLMMPNFTRKSGARCRA